MGLENEQISDTSSYDEDAMASEILGNDSHSNQVSDDETEGQSETDPDKTVTDENADPGNILKLVANEKVNPADSTELLGKINSLGLTRNGLPINVESPEVLKELIQKGYDYTQKTMEHAETVKVKEAEYAQFKESEAAFTQKTQQFETTLQNHDMLVDIVTDIQKNDPELFAHLDSMMVKRQNDFNVANKYREQFDGKVLQLKSEIDGLKSGKQAEELNGIKQGWEKGLSETQTSHAASLLKLGVKADWEKVKAAWAADTTEKMSVEQALFAVHGKDIFKANESYQKLLATKNKVQSAQINRSGVGGGSKSGNLVLKGKPGDTDSLVDELFNSENFN